jgi:DNA-binding MarR family transcriptional regulator
VNNKGFNRMQKINKEPTGILYLIGRAEKVISRQMRKVLKPLGLSLRDYTALSVFSTYQTISSAKLAELTIVSPQAANELIKEMEERAWIIKQPDPNHGRIIQIQLTEMGKSKLAASNSVVAELDKNIFGDLTEKEIVELKSHLKRVLKFSSE